MTRDAASHIGRSSVGVNTRLTNIRSFPKTLRGRTGYYANYRALNQLKFPYLMSGSLAGAVHSAIRAMIDTDLVTVIPLKHARPLARALSVTTAV
jgi:hypothetical protein